MSNSPVASLRSIQMLGSGIGYRHELHAAILAARGDIDFLEIVTEQFMGPARREQLAALCEEFTVVPHGVGLSIGSASLDADYLREARLVSDLSGAPYYSEHLAMTRAPGLDLGHLGPLWRNERTLRVVIDNVLRVQDVLGKPLVLENISYLLEPPGSTMSQPEMFHRLVDATGCGVLLDITNVAINAANHRFDALDFIRAMPLGHVMQVHLAGGFEHEGIMIDGHSEPVDQESWSLLRQLAEMGSAVRGCIVEHDANFPEEPVALFAQLREARDILFGRRLDRERPCASA